MFGLFVLLGMSLIVISIIAFIVLSIRRKKKKKILTVLLFGIVLFIVGAVNLPSAPANKTNSDTTKEVSKLSTALSDEDIKTLKSKSANYAKVLNDSFGKEEVVFRDARKEKDGSLTAVYETSSKATFQVLFDSNFNFIGVSSNQNGDSEKDKNIYTNLCAMSVRIKDFEINEINNEISMSLSGVSEDPVNLDKCNMIHVNSMHYFIIMMNK